MTATAKRLCHGDPEPFDLQSGPHFDQVQLVRDVLSGHEVLAPMDRDRVSAQLQHRVVPQTLFHFFNGFRKSLQFPKQLCATLEAPFDDHVQALHHDPLTGLALPAPKDHQGGP